MWAFIQSLFKKQEKEIDPMKYLIVGLGNPGGEYEETRHNIGFKVVDHITESKDGQYKDDRHGFISQVKHKGRTIYLLKPMTYMNLSGKAVKYWVDKLSISPENLLVIVDDLNLNFGVHRVRKSGKAGGHNGLKDITEKFASQDYARLRVGIGNEFKRGQQVDYVLGEWSEEERKGLPRIIDLMAKAVLTYCSMDQSRSIGFINSMKLKKPKVED